MSNLCVATSMSNLRSLNRMRQMNAAMLLAAICLFPVLPACAASSGETGVSTVDEAKLDLHAIVFLGGKNGARPVAFERAEWSQVPSDELIASVFPAGERKSGYAEINCRLADDRSLSDCSINAIEPDNEPFRRAFLSLVQNYRLAGPTPHPNEVAFVNMLMRLHRGFAPGEPCGPFCVPTPPPPPPPVKD